MLGDRHCAQAHEVSASIVCFQKREKKKKMPEILKCSSTSGLISYISVHSFIHTLARDMLGTWLQT